MKRAFSLLLLVLFLLCTACTGKTPPVPTEAPTEAALTEAPAPTAIDMRYTYDPETDVDNRYAMRYANIVERDNMFVWASYCNTPLFFYDKETDFGGVLCNKPECEHTTSDCSSAIATKSICFYDGGLYILPSWPDMQKRCWIIYSMELDSSDRKVFMTIPDEEDGSMTLKRMFIHRGKMYFVNEYQAVEEGKPANKFELLTCDFDGPNAADLKPVVKIESYAWFINRLFFAGDKIFVFSGPTIGGHYRLLVEMYDTVSGETSTVSDVILDDDYFIPDYFYVTQDGEILCGQSGTTYDQNCKAYRIVGNELEVFMEFEETEFEGKLCSWMSVQIGEDTVTASTMISKNPRQDAVWIRDFEGNTIYKGLLPTLQEGAPNYDTIDYFEASHDRILLSVQENKENSSGTVIGTTYFFVEYDLTEDGYTVKPMITYKTKPSGT
ncbi:MAG: hypothetical protein IKX58_03635 [Clostridia bacterium]|nr:hypothetical protein [Clostridia bacterium]